MRENEFQEQVEEAYRIKENEDAERQARVSIVISNYYFVVT